MFKILLGTPAFPPDKGGASEYFRILYSMLKEHGFEVTVITYGKDRNSDIKGIGITRWSKFVALNFFISFLITFLKFFRINPDIIHVHTTSGLCFALSIIGYLKKIPVIRDVRDLQAPNWIIKYPKANAYIVCCRSGLDFLKKKGISTEKIIFIPPAADIRVMQNKSKKDILKLLYVGELNIKKGINDIIKVIDDISNEFDFKLVVVGDGPLRDVIKKASKKICSIDYKGPLPHDNVLELMLRSDVLVYPSYDECYPRAIIEALAMGCAIVAYDVGDIKEIVGEAGIVCKPSYKQLKKCLTELLLNPKRVYELKINAHNEFRKQIPLNKAIEKTITLYTSLIREKYEKY